MNEKCWHCGADEALHMAGPIPRCPRNGREAPVGKRQEWENTVFTDVKAEQVRRAAPSLLTTLKNIMSKDKKSILADFAYQGPPSKHWLAKEGKFVEARYEGYNKCLAEVQAAARPAIAEAEKVQP